MKKVLAFDLGASSGRAILGKFDGKKIETEEIHRFKNSPVEAVGHFYWDILSLFREIVTGIHKCVLSGNGDILSIAIDTWGVDYGLLDREGELLCGVYHYRDQRTNGIESYLEDKIGLRELFYESGIQNIWFNTSYQLAAFANEKGYLFASAEKLLMIPDLLGYFLTGITKSEYTVAVTTQLYDVKNGCWNAALMEKLHIPQRLFCDIIYPGETLGYLTRELQEKLKTGRIPVVSVAAHDTASALCAVPAKNDDFAFISCGTWSIFGTELQRPVINEDVFKAGFSNEGSADRKIKFLKNIMGLWIIQECRNFWIGEGEEVSFAALEARAKEAEAFCQFIDVEDESFKNPVSMPDAIKAFCRKTSQPVPETKGQIIRCAVESLALKYRNSLEELVKITGKTVETVHLVGGGAKDKLLCQFTANSTGKRVIAGPAEGTAVGNIAMQLIAAKELSSIAEARKIIGCSVELEEYLPEEQKQWEKAYRRYLDIAYVGRI